MAVASCFDYKDVLYSCFVLPRLVRRARRLFRFASIGETCYKHSYESDAVRGQEGGREQRRGKYITEQVRHLNSKLDQQDSVKQERYLNTAQVSIDGTQMRV